MAHILAYHDLTAMPEKQKGQIGAKEIGVEDDKKKKKDGLN